MCAPVIQVNLFWKSRKAAGAYPPTVWALLSNKPGIAGPWGGRLEDGWAAPGGSQRAQFPGGGLLPLCCPSVAALPVSPGSHHMSARWSLQTGSRMEPIRFLWYPRSWPSTLVLQKPFMPRTLTGLLHACHT